jgi:hypothetical protein
MPISRLRSSCPSRSWLGVQLSPSTMQNVQVVAWLRHCSWWMTKPKKSRLSHRACQNVRERTPATRKGGKDAFCPHFQSMAPKFLSWWQIVAIIGAHQSQIGHKLHIWRHPPNKSPNRNLRSSAIEHHALFNKSPNRNLWSSAIEHHALFRTSRNIPIHQLFGLIHCKRMKVQSVGAMRVAVESATVAAF